MTATRRGEGFGRSASDAALRGALLVAVAVIIGALLIWRGHKDDNNTGAITAGTGTTTRATTSTTLKPGTVTTRSPVTTPGVTTPIGATRQAATVKVLVANGSGVDGYATQVAQKLATGSYASIGAENAKPGQANTLIYYRDTYQEDARALAVFLGSSANVVQAIPASLADKLDQAVVNRAQGANIVIILGADKEVKVG